MRQLQHEYDQHGLHWGFDEPQNKQNLSDFRATIQAHVDDIDTMRIEGTYHGKPATHYLNPIQASMRSSIPIGNSGGLGD
jgi:hypothetical protein